MDSFLKMRLHSRTFCLERREWRVGETNIGERAEVKSFIADTTSPVWPVLLLAEPPPARLNMLVVGVSKVGCTPPSSVA